MSKLTGSQVIGLLKDMLYDFGAEDRRYQALTQAIDALESVTVVTVAEDGQAHVTEIHPLLDAEVYYD